MEAATGGTVAKNAWIVVDEKGVVFPSFTVSLPGERKLYTAIASGDWLLMADAAGKVTRVGQVLRLRSDLERTVLYLDRLLELDGTALATVGLALPASGRIARLQWSDFAAALQKLTSGTIDDVPLAGSRQGKENEDAAYVRELVQLAVMDDLLGPASGPHEQIVDMSVRDRYLVGKLAPREAERGGIEGLQGPLAAEAEEEPDDLDVHRGRHEPGAEFDSTTGRADAEADAADEIDAASNQSLVPSSLGFTFCVDGDAKQIEVEARWGQYVRVYEHEHTKTINKKIKDAEGNVIRTEQTQVKAKVWQRQPCGGTMTIDLVDV